MSKLYLIGGGPGDHAYLTQQAQSALAQASDIVAYQLYIDLLDQLVTGKNCHAKPLGQEVERARLALDLATQGKITALVSSGDIGIYAMATLVFELLDQSASTHWREVDIEVIPGISAMQMAASRIGAPLGHDFCTISLSDLLTPWETIQTRIEAAAMGDFVIAFYNPVSSKRQWQIVTARDILLTHRPPTTPVVLGKNLTRDNETVAIINLVDLQPEAIDMTTLVMIGNRESRIVQHQQRQWLYTPRGYRAKLTKEKS